MPSLSDIATAASLAHHGLLTSIETMTLLDVDLASVPAQHLASLASCVTKRMGLTNVTNCDIISILDCLNIDSPNSCLNFNCQTLGNEETRAVVRAMESNVETLFLGMSTHINDFMSLDMMALTQYNGQGKCVKVKYMGREYTYIEEFVKWAQMINWEVEEEGCLKYYRDYYHYFYFIIVKRKQDQ